MTRLVGFRLIGVDGEPTNDRVFVNPEYVVSISTHRSRLSEAWMTNICTRDGRSYLVNEQIEQVTKELATPPSQPARHISRPRPCSG